MDKDLYDNLYGDVDNLYGDVAKLYEAVDKIHDKLYHFEKLKDDIENVENLKAERENKSSNNYLGFSIAASAFMALFVSAICCGISCTDRVKVEETPTEIRINLDNPQNMDIHLYINHG